MKLLQVPTIALEQRIKQEIEENPALEEGEKEQEETTDELEEEIPDDFTGDENEDEDLQSDSEKKEDDEFAFDDYVEDDEIPVYRLIANNTSPDEERKEIPYSSGITFSGAATFTIGLTGFR